MQESNNGLVMGIVRDLEDPEGLGRVRVEFPHLGNVMSNWARLCTPMGGGGQGVFFRPDPDQRVAVVFEQGDPRRPCILGGLWSRAEPPPEDDGDARSNNWRFIRSRSGHLIKLDDTSGGERIEIVASGGKQTVVLDAASGKIQISCEQGDVEIAAGQGTVSLDAGTIELTSSGSMTLEAGGTMTIRGQMVNIN